MSPPLNGGPIWNLRAMRFVSWLFLIGSASATILAVLRGETMAAIAAHLFCGFLVWCGHLEVHRFTTILERRARRNLSRAMTHA